MKAEFKGRSEFAEFAEVLETTTEYIFAARMEKSRWFVLYTPDYGEGDNTMWSAWLKRDAEGILRLDSVKRAQPGLWERIEREIMEKFGEGGNDDES